MREEEAKTKWCPFVRFLHETDRWRPMNNREEVVRKDGEVSRCIASECMAFRIDHYELQDDGTNVPDGYCGLSGKP